MAGPTAGAGHDTRPQTCWPCLDRHSDAICWAGIGVQIRRLHVQGIRRHSILCQDGWQAWL